VTRNHLPSLKKFPALALLAAAGLILSACQKQEEITVYRIPKEMPGRAPAPHGEMPAGPRPHVHWEKLPAGWHEEPSAGARAATFSVTGTDGKRAEVVAVGFPGMGGTDLEFVNLWREQLTLDPLSEEQLAKLVQPVTVAGGDGKLFDITGTARPGGKQFAGDRIVIALRRIDGISWFIKLTGNPAFVEQQKPAFIGFLKDISFHMEKHDSPARPAMTTSAAPAAPVAPAASSGKPAWTVPAQWKPLTPGAMQTAKFSVGEGKTAAEITAVFLGGTGGALKANLDRWRGQLGLAPSAANEVDQQAKPIETLGAGARIVELSGTEMKEGNPADMVVLVVPAGGGTWFYKLMGDKGVVAREKDAFITFVKSAKP